MEYNRAFRLFLHTKLSNPHYPPEVCSRALLVNFTVKQAGLEEQLLAAAVRAERPDLDRQRGELVVKVAQGKRTQVRA